MQPPATLAWHQDVPLLSLEKEIIENQLPVLDPLFSPGFYPMGLFQPHPWTGHSLLSWRPRLECCCLPLSILFGSWSGLTQGLCSQICPQPSYPQISSSLSVDIRSSRAGSSIPCVRKLSLTHSKNLLVCSCPAVLSFQQIFGWCKYTVKTRVCNCEAFPVVWKRTHLLLLPEEALCSRQPQCHPILVCPLTHKLSAGSSPSPGRAARSPADLSHAGQLTFLTFPSSPKFCTHPSQHKFYNYIILLTRMPP